MFVDDLSCLTSWRKARVVRPIGAVSGCEQNVGPRRMSRFERPRPRSGPDRARRVHVPPCCACPGVIASANCQAGRDPLRWCGCRRAIVGPWVPPGAICGTVRPAPKQVVCAQSGGLRPIRQSFPPHMRGPDRGRDRASHPLGPPRPLALPDKAQGPARPVLFSAPAVFGPAGGRPTRRRKDDAETPHTVRRRRQALPPLRPMVQPCGSVKMGKGIVAPIYSASQNKWRKAENTPVFNIVKCKMRCSHF
jgi:hypothetical protein